MKNKKFSGVFAFILSVCLALTTFSFLGAKADGEGTYAAEKSVLAAMEYEVTELFEGATAVKSVKKGGADAVNGATLDKENEDDKTALADYWYGKTTEKDGKTEFVAEGNIVFNYVGANVSYDVTLTVPDKEGKDTEKLVKVTVVDKADKAPEYDAAVLKNLDLVRKAFAEATVTDKKLTVPSEIWTLLGDSANYPVGKVTAKIYHRSPRSVWSSAAATSGTKNSSSLKVTLSDAGVNYFYVLFSVKTTNLFDTSVNKELVMEKDSEWKERVDGFYSGDGETAILEIPIFTYNYQPESSVTITAKSSVSTGKVGMSNSSLSFTYENAYKAQCVLMYAPLDSDNWKNAADFTDKNKVAEYDADALKSYSSGSAITFTPLVKGKFKVVCSAMGVDSDELTVKESQIVKVSSEMRVLKPENTAFRDFFKDNTMAVIFLGVALLCLIAIIVIACWKPKDGKPAVKVEDAKTEKKAAKVEAKSAVEEAPAEETAPEATETPADEAPVEEAAEEAAEEVPAEEVAPEVTEAPAEEAPAEEVAPAEEAPAEETPAEEAAPEAPADESPKAE